MAGAAATVYLPVLAVVVAVVTVVEPPLHVLF
jgi:hypothetical protein